MLASMAEAPSLPLTVTQAASLWGVTRQRVLVLCQAGRVSARLQGGIWLIYQLERPAKERPGPDPRPRPASDGPG